MTETRSAENGSTKTISKADQAKEFFAQFRRGEIINHKRYGRARVLKHMQDVRKRHGVLLKLLDKDKIFLFYHDRCGILERCFEPNMFQIEAWTKDE